MKQKERKRLCLLAGMIFILAASVLSQTTGKITGIVRDASSHEPLTGVNILLVGTPLGAASDAQGEFYIINVPPGAYTVEARMIGYSPVRIEQVRVSVNRTVPVEFKLPASILEGEVVTVRADKMVLKKDQTSSIRNISAEDIENLPAESIGEVVAMQPGVVGGHFRGGRSNEVTYMIDGVAVTDAYSHSSKTSDVNPEIVEDVEVITGTFNAEYGDAMSGVVNVVTREGGNRLDGDASIHFGNYITPHKHIFEGLRNDEFDRIRDFKAALSGPVWKNRVFFVSNFRWQKDMGHLSAMRLFNPADFSDFTSQNQSEWAYNHTGDSSLVPMNGYEGYSGYGKLTFRFSPSLKASGALNWNRGSGQGYDHASRFNPDGSGSWHSETTLGVLHINHLVSRSAFYDLRISHNDYWTGSYLFGDPLDSRYIHDEYSRNNGSWFYTGGQSKSHFNLYEKKTGVKLDMTWQAGKQHSLKSGAELSLIDLKHVWYGIRNGYEGSGLENEYLEDPFTLQRLYLFYRPVIHANESVHTDLYHEKPVQASAYLQDKMEFDLMVVNVGLRFDYFDPKNRYPSNYRNPANQIYSDDPARISVLKKSDVKTQVSPRLGLSYSLGGNALLRFAYGHFLQMPPLTYFYQNSGFWIAAWDYGTRNGNGQLKPQKTIQYEVGLFQQLTRDMTLEVAVWYKDIYDLVTATVYTTYNQTRYGMYTNKEYGNARGLEVKYDWRVGVLSAGLNYTFGYTKGVADNPESSFSRAGSEKDPVNKLIPLNWDQRHTLNIYAGYNTAGYGATLMLYLNSGQPYTWSPISQSPLSAVNLFPNNQYRPGRISTDLNAYLNLARFKGASLRLTLLVYNLFDRLNESWVNSQTGRAYTAVVQETDILGHRSLFSTYEDVYQNPSMYSTPRSVKLGLGISF
ncbi:TonB-dependent receptor [bacterium]|nr:TonB-dependent receptor [bacterium]